VGTGLARQTISNEAGQYTIPNLSVGTYQVAAVKQGFNKAVVDQVKLEVQLVRTVDLVLQVGQALQEVTVRAGVTPLETTQSFVGTLLENKLVNQLPLNGRNFLQLQLLLPGVTLGRAGTWSVVKIDSASREIGGGNFSVGGMRDLYNDYLLDGVSFKEWIHGTASMNPSVDAVQEFRTQTSNYTAESGSNAGGLVDLVTKSGTNGFRGAVYEFLRNDKFDAADFFTNAAGAKKVPLRRNQFGAGLGGPIRRDKTFFFANYEGFRERRSRTLSATLPTAKMRQGDFSELLNQPTPQTIHDPFTGVPYAGNVIPSGILPFWAPFFTGYVPLPNQAGLQRNYIVPGGSSNNTDQVIGRIDHQLSDKTSLSGRYVSNTTFDAPFHTLPAYTTQSNHEQNMLLHLSHSISPNTMLDFKEAYNRFYQNYVGSRANTTPFIARDIMGIKGLASDPRASDAPCLSVTRFSAFGCVAGSAPRQWYSERYEHRGAVYLVRGRHNVRLGLDAYRHHETFPEIIEPTGFYGFAGIYTSYALADMLLGMPNYFEASPDLFDPNFRFWEIMPWVQDDWRVTKKLTINLGLRYEWWGRPQSRHNVIANVRLPADSNEIYSAVAAPCVMSSYHKCYTFIPTKLASTRSTLQNDNNNFAPRVGFAYKVGGSDRTVVRGAYGIFYQREPINQFIFLSINLPFVAFYNIFPSLSDFPNNFSFQDPLAHAAGSEIQDTYIPEHYVDGYLQSWNLGVQRNLAAGVVVDLSYVGNKDTHLVARTWPNQPMTPGPGPIAARRRYQNVSTLAGNEPIGNSNYNSMQVKAEKRFSQGLSFLSSYTWAKAITDSQGAESGTWATADLQNNWNRKANRGLFSGDIRHRFTLAYVYELPFGKGKRYLSGTGTVASKAISGWQMSGLSTYQTGQPLSALISTDVANTGDGARFPELSGNANDGPKTRLQYFNTRAFRYPAPYTYGNAGVGIISGPGIGEIDLALSRDMKIGERINLQFRGEFFNLTNHFIMGNPDTNLDSSTYGEILNSALPSRELEFGLRLTF